MLFTSRPETPDEEIELSRVIDQTVHALPLQTLAQALLDEDEPSTASAFAHAGFTSIGFLAYMRRTRPTRADTIEPWPASVRVRHYMSCDDEALIHAMERSYEQTLDCPELCGLRNTKDVLDTHRATGVWDPALWWIVEQHDAPMGLLLFNPCPDLDSIELVYVGLAPALRGMGIGSKLLKFGLNHLIARREQTVTCAVDERNAPARSLYESLGFERFARRHALVRLRQRSHD